MKDDKILQENFTEEERKAIAEGRAFAIRMPEPAISARLFTIALAFLVVGMAAPLYMGISTFIYYGGLIGAVGWLSLAKMYANKIAQLQAENEISIGMFKILADSARKLVEKQEDTSKENGELSDD